MYRKVVLVKHVKEVVIFDWGSIEKHCFLLILMVTDLLKLALGRIITKTGNAAFVTHRIFSPNVNSIGDIMRCITFKIVS